MLTEAERLTLMRRSATMPAVRSAGKARLVILFFLSAWAVPLAASCAVGMHVAAQHGHHEPSAEIALAIAHGHAHDLGAPAHSHDATRPDGPASPQPGAGVELIDSLLICPDSPLVSAPALHPTHSPPWPTTLSPLRL